jgi:hypothetical protein
MFQVMTRMLVAVQGVGEEADGGAEGELVPVPPMMRSPVGGAGAPHPCA